MARLQDIGSGMARKLWAIASGARHSAAPPTPAAVKAGNDLVKLYEHANDTTLTDMQRTFDRAKGGRPTESGVFGEMLAELATGKVPARAPWLYDWKASGLKKPSFSIKLVGDELRWDGTEDEDTQLCHGCGHPITKVCGIDCYRGQKNPGSGRRAGGDETGDEWDKSHLKPYHGPSEDYPMSYDRWSVLLGKAAALTGARIAYGPETHDAWRSGKSAMQYAKERARLTRKRNPAEQWFRITWREPNRAKPNSGVYPQSEVKRITRWLAGQGFGDVTVVVEPERRRNPADEKLREKWGENTEIVIERGAHGYMGWLESSKGGRLPISFGREPATAREAMELAKSFLRKVHGKVNPADKTCKAPGCGKQMRMRYPGNDPENGPAQLFCPTGHSRCQICSAPCGGEDYESDLCDSCMAQQPSYGEDLYDEANSEDDERVNPPGRRFHSNLAGSNPAGLTAKRSSTFRDDGLYDVFDGEKLVAKLFRDPGDREWYEENLPGQPQTHYIDRWRGSTQAEALERLARRRQARSNPTPDYKSAARALIKRCEAADIDNGEALENWLTEGITGDAQCDAILRPVMGRTQADFDRMWDIVMAELVRVRDLKRNPGSDGRVDSDDARAWGAEAFEMGLTLAEARRQISDAGCPARLLPEVDATFNRARSQARHREA